VNRAGKARAAAVIPVRVGSQRLPGKAMLRESGMPLFLHTVFQARKAKGLAGVWVATDDDGVAAAAGEHGVPVVRTSPECRTGSERVAEAARSIDAAALIDVQGDWPEVDPADLEAMADQLLSGAAVCNTLAAPLHERIQDPNVVKVVRGLQGNALYFSRAPIPYVKQGPFPVLRHIGVYGFDRTTLLRVPDLPSSGLDQAESLEQLRFLENGVRIQVLDAHGDPWGIEARGDYDAFLVRLGVRR
jgi:3-deoxy-manno-octulosonate cytidylyltransferase (CMP-KDO synthetase)